MAALVDSILSLLGWKLPFKFVYSNEYWMMDIGPHVFPVKKYRLLYEGVIALGAGPGDFIEAKPASEEDLLLVHTPKYVRKAMSGNLSSLELQALELPFSPAVLRFFYADDRRNDSDRGGGFKNRSGCSSWRRIPSRFSGSRRRFLFV